MRTGNFLCKAFIPLLFCAFVGCAKQDTEARGILETHQKELDDFQVLCERSVKLQSDLQGAVAAGNFLMGRTYTDQLSMLQKTLAEKRDSLGVVLRREYQAANIGDEVAARCWRNYWADKKLDMRDWDRKPSP